MHVPECLAEAGPECGYLASYTRWKQFRDGNRGIMARHERREFDDVLLYLIDWTFGFYETDNVRLKLRKDVFPHLLKIYNCQYRPRAAREVSRMPIFTKIKCGTYTTTKTEWAEHLERNGIRIRDFSRLESTLSWNPHRSGEAVNREIRPLLLTEREYFSDFLSGLFEAGQGLSRDELVSFAYYGIGDRAERNGTRKSRIHSSEVAYKFHSWFLRDRRIRPGRIPFSRVGAGRDMILDVCRHKRCMDDHSTAAAPTSDVERLMGISIEDYFPGGEDELAARLEPGQQNHYVQAEMHAG